MRPTPFAIAFWVVEYAKGANAKHSMNRMVCVLSVMKRCQSSTRTFTETTFCYTKTVTQLPKKTVQLCTQLVIGENKRKTALQWQLVFDKLAVTLIKGNIMKQNLYEIKITRICGPTMKHRPPPFFQCAGLVIAKPTRWRLRSKYFSMVSGTWHACFGGIVRPRIISLLF